MRYLRCLHIGCAGALLLLTFYLRRLVGSELPVRYFREQDLPILTGLSVAWIVVALLPMVRRMELRCATARTGFWVVLLGVMALLLWWGTYAIMFDYALTRDEHMVLFDMVVFAKGHLAEPLAPAWRSLAEALVPAFLLEPVDPAGMVSNYLPGNALARLIFSRIADPALFNPVLAALGGLALLDVGRRLFSDDRSALAVAMLLYVSSAQMLVNAMTVYAMNPHMVLNLIWLAAFLRGGKAGHGIAMLVGAYALGLHQLIFHPLFAGPFLLWRLARREWGVVIFYGCGYLLSVLFWTHYAGVASLYAVAPGAPGGGANADFLRDRLMPLLLLRDPNTMLLMGLNVARFLAWQNLALLPLLVASWTAVRRNDGIAASLLAGPVLGLLVIAFLLPYQGHGWGYRYLHPFLGSFALLGGYGWKSLRDRLEGHAPMGVALLACLTLVTSLPWQLFQSHRFVAPYVRLDHLVQSARTDMILVDTEAPAAAIDQVRNLPDLTNRPIRISSKALKQEDVLLLCRRGTLSLVTRQDMHDVGFALDVPTTSPAFDTRIAPITGAGCLRNRDGSPRG